jgi:hypothetical protein
MPIIYKQRGSLRHESLSELHRQNSGVLQFKTGCGSCKYGGQADIRRCTSVPRTERRQGDDRYSAPPACIRIPDSDPRLASLPNDSCCLAGFRSCQRAQRIAQAAHHFLELRQVERLWSIGERAFRTGMHFDDNAIGADGDGGA